MVLERSVLLLQQEEEEFGPDEGIHGAQRKEKHGEKKRKQKMEGTHGGKRFGRGFPSRFAVVRSTRNRGNIEQSLIKETSTTGARQTHIPTSRPDNMN